MIFMGWATLVNAFKFNHILSRSERACVHLGFRAIQTGKNSSPRPRQYYILIAQAFSGRRISREGREGGEGC
jgi:hypothetical protein